MANMHKMRYIVLFYNINSEYSIYAEARTEENAIKLINESSTGYKPDPKFHQDILDNIDWSIGQDNFNAEPCYTSQEISEDYEWKPPPGKYTPKPYPPEEYWTDTPKWQMICPIYTEYQRIVEVETDLETESDNDLYIENGEYIADSLIGRVLDAALKQPLPAHQTIIDNLYYPDHDAEIEKISNEDFYFSDPEKRAQP